MHRLTEAVVDIQRKKEEDASYRHTKKASLTQQEEALNRSKARQYPTNLGIGKYVNKID